MKASKYLFFLFFILVCISAKAQIVSRDSINNEVYMNIDENFVDNKSEKIDIAWLEKHGRAMTTENNPNYRIDIQKDSVTTIVEGNRVYGCSCFKYFDNSCFKIVKHYYPNGNIRTKGWIFSNSGTKKGIWYEFDEDGNLERSVDYDKLTKVTFDDVLKVCEKENIPLLKGYQYNRGGYANVSRYFDDAASCYRWSISWLKSFDLREKIVFDGKTGKILERIEKAFISN